MGVGGSRGLLSLISLQVRQDRAPLCPARWEAFPGGRRGHLVETTGQLPGKGDQGMGVWAGAGGHGAREPLCLTQPPPAGGGPDELAKRFQSGRIMYGLCRLWEPTAGVPHIVLIHWVRMGRGSWGWGACSWRTSKGDRPWMPLERHETGPRTVGPSPDRSGLRTCAQPPRIARTGRAPASPPWAILDAFTMASLHRDCFPIVHHPEWGKGHLSLGGEGGCLALG